MIATATMGVVPIPAIRGQRRGTSAMRDPVPRVSCRDVNDEVQRMGERRIVEVPSADADHTVDAMVLLAAAPECQLHPGEARRVLRERSSGYWTVECGVM